MSVTQHSIRYQGPHIWNSLPAAIRDSEGLHSFQKNKQMVREHLIGQNYFFLLTLVLVIIIIIKRGWQCKAGRDRLTPYQSEDPNPTTPTHRKKEEKGKTVGDKKGASS